MTETAYEVLTIDQGRESVGFCDSYNRLPTLIRLAELMETTEWLTLFGEEWQSCDNIGAFADELIFETPLRDAIDDPSLRQHLMDFTEQLALENLPEEFTIWRGCYASNKWGLSWSLDREVAAMFPTLHRYRQQGQPLLVKARIRKRDVLALKLDRGEAEVIAWRGHGSTLKQVSVSHIRTP